MSKVNTITILGKTYEAKDWRRALFDDYLCAGLWAGQKIIPGPHINFDGIVLARMPNGHFFVYRIRPHSGESIPDIDYKWAAQATHDGDQVQVALAEFVKNDRLEQLEIQVDDSRIPGYAHGSLRLWKGRKRGDLYCEALDVSTEKQIERHLASWREFHF